MVEARVEPEDEAPGGGACLGGRDLRQRAEEAGQAGGPFGIPAQAGDAQPQAAGHLCVGNFDSCIR